MFTMPLLGTKSLSAGEQTRGTGGGEGRRGEWAKGGTDARSNVQRQRWYMGSHFDTGNLIEYAGLFFHKVVYSRDNVPSRDVSDEQ
jgi:hypothetical protein